jgi:hypothetical protein
LWWRVTALCPGVLAAAIGKSKTFPEVRQETLAAQGKKVTPLKLYQRADKAGRYGEFNPYLDCVRAAYLGIVKAPAPGGTDGGDRPSVTNVELRAIAAGQGWRCYYCTADLRAAGLEGVICEHHVPKKRGGRTVPWNTVAACVRCNEEKGDMSSYEYGKLVGARQARGRKL